MTEPGAGSDATTLPQTANSNDNNIVQHNTRRTGNHPPFPSEDNASGAAGVDKSGAKALEAQRIVRPPPKRKTMGSNPIRGTRHQRVFHFLSARPVPARCSYNGQYGGFPSRRRGSDSRTPLEGVCRTRPSLAQSACMRHAPGYAGSPTVGRRSPKPQARIRLPPGMPASVM